MLHYKLFYISVEQKYGSKALNSGELESTDSEDENDEPLEVSEEVEKQFLKTLSLLKTKDPRIYDSKFNFFDEKIEKEKGIFYCYTLTHLLLYNLIPCCL